MLARVGPSECADDFVCLVGDLSHEGHVIGVPEVQCRAYVQTSDRGMGVPGPVCVMTSENLTHLLGVCSQVLQGHRAVLDEGDGLPRPCHRHDDVEAGFSECPDSPLTFGRDRGLHAVGETEIAQKGGQLGELRYQRCRPRPLLRRRELHEEQGTGLAPHERGHGIAKLRPLSRESEYVAVDQFDGARLHLDQMLDGIQGSDQRGKMTNSQHASRRLFRESQA